MEQKATLQITFTRDPLEGEDVKFFRIKDDGTQTFASKMDSVFASSRNDNFELPILPPTLIPGENAAIAYEKYFDADFNVAGLMTIERVENVVTIEIDSGWDFGNFTSSAGATFIHYQYAPDSFQISSIQILESSTPCETAILRITTTEQADDYQIGTPNAYSEHNPRVPVSSTTVLIEIDRVTPTTIKLSKAGHLSLDASSFFNEPHFYIRSLRLANKTILVHPTLIGGATISVDVRYQGQLSQRPPLSAPLLSYSLNGTDWMTSSVFNGQVDGSYTMWIKDTLGCVIQKDYVISGIKNAREPHIEISDLNSVGFAESEIWNDNQDGIIKNPENTLDQTSRESILDKELIVFREQDNIRIQFKSNYDYNEAFVESCDNENIYSPIIEKMSNNLDLYEVLDAKMYSYGDGSLTAIYYDAGTVYDKFNVPIDAYELNGNLPDSAIVGNAIKITPQGAGIGGVFEVMDVFYDSEMGKNIMVFQFDCECPVPVDVITYTVYDLLNYDIYEFNVPFSTVIGRSNLSPLPSRFSPQRDFRLRIRCADELYNERNFYSNWIDVFRENQEFDSDRFFTFNYSNNNNRSIFYLYGITHFFRAEVDFSNSLIDDSVEIVKGDSSSYLTESVVNHGIQIKFAPVTHKVLMKYILAISSENLFVNGLGYVKMGKVESEPIENTNLYNLTCTLLRNSQNFNTFAKGRTGEPEDYKSMYIPQLITTNLGGSLKV